jgi:hypothetical protein
MMAHRMQAALVDLADRRVFLRHADALLLSGVLGGTFGKVLRWGKTVARRVTHE